MSIANIAAKAVNTCILNAVVPKGSASVSSMQRNSVEISSTNSMDNPSAEQLTMTLDTYNDPEYAKAFIEKGMASNERIPEVNMFIKKVREMNIERPTVIDAGCGWGRFLPILSGADLDVYGVDGSLELLNYADTYLRSQAIDPSGRLFCNDLRQINFPDGYFNAVFARASILHLPIEDAISAVNEFFRIAAHDALIYIKVKEGKGGTIETDDDGYQRFFQYFTKNEMRSIMLNAGFKAVRIYLFTEPSLSYGKAINWLNVWARKP